MASNLAGLLEAVKRATDKSSSQAAYNAVLNGVGNNHQGTLYSEAENAVEPLLEIAISEPGWPANTALNALTEMLGSFESAPVEADRAAADPEMKRRMLVVVARRRNDLVSLADGVDEFGTAKCARDLVAELNSAQ